MLSLALYYPPLSLFGGFFLRINDKKKLYIIERECETAKNQFAYHSK